MTENSADYEFSLANQFFADIDAPEIQKGKLQVQLNVRKTMGVYVLTFHIEGSVIVPCDRCLDDLELPVMTDDTLKVKLGAAFSDEEDMVIVPEEDGYINVAWFMYEFIALSLPMKHVHAPGKCNKGMMGALNKHLRTSVDEEEEKLNKSLEKWHILKEDNQKRELRREELMTRQLLLRWLFARTAAHGMFITQYVGLVVITEVSWLSKKKLLFNNLTLC